MLPNNLGPSMKKGIEYLKKHPNAGYLEVKDGAGIGRTSAVKAVRIFKDIKPEKKEQNKKTPKSKPKPPVKEKVAKTKVKPKEEKKPVKKKKRKGTKPNNMLGYIDPKIVPPSLIRAPRFNLDGFHLNSDGELDKEGVLVWDSTLYIGVCPVCIGQVKLFKNAMRIAGGEETNQRYSGKCTKCDIEVSISRSK